MEHSNPVPTIACSRCGAQFEAQARYCTNCGQPVRTPVPDPTAWQQSAPASVPAYAAAYDSSGGIGKLVSAAGRIGRLEYFLTIVAIWLVLLALAGIVSATDSTLAVLLAIVVWVPATIIAICAGIKRLHDFDQSGWLYLLMLVPIASFIFLFVLFLKGSSPGLNQYGYADSGSVMG